MIIFLALFPLFVVAIYMICDFLYENRQSRQNKRRQAIWSSFLALKRFPTEHDGLLDMYGSDGLYMCVEKYPDMIAFTAFKLRDMNILKFNYWRLWQ